MRSIFLLFQRRAHPAGASFVQLEISLSSLAAACKGRPGLLWKNPAVLQPGVNGGQNFAAHGLPMRYNDREGGLSGKKMRRHVTVMPDTLAHFGIQILASKAVCRQTDVHWIGLGCLLPDLPWILQRLLLPFAEPITLRLYAVIQSSLFFCLLISAALSLQAADSRRIFLLLAMNSLAHLLLDPLEIKWGNGTILAAPFSWQMTKFSWFWPEELPSRLLSLVGLLIFPFFAWRERGQEMQLIRARKRQAAGIALLLVYLLLPLALRNGPLQVDSHYAATLQDRQGRAGKMVEFDRRPFRASDRTLRSYSGELLRLKGGNLPRQDGIISIQGRFLSNKVILVTARHVHSRLRDWASKLGIFFLIGIWLLALCEKRIRIVTISPNPLRLHPH